MIEFRKMLPHYSNDVGLENAAVRIEGDFVFLVGPVVQVRQQLLG